VKYFLLVLLYIFSASVCFGKAVAPLKKPIAVATEPAQLVTTAVKTSINKDDDFDEKAEFPVDTYVTKQILEDQHIINEIRGEVRPSRKNASKCKGVVLHSMVRWIQNSKYYTFNQLQMIDIDSPVVKYAQEKGVAKALQKDPTKTSDQVMARKSFEVFAAAPTLDFIRRISEYAINDFGVPRPRIPHRSPSGPTSAQAIPTSPPTRTRRTWTQPAGTAATLTPTTTCNWSTLSPTCRRPATFKAA
jgi:uncharacterized protein (DUF2267 family)